MKTKLLTISLLLFTSQVFSEEAKVLKEETFINGRSKLKVICIDGYKYLNALYSPTYNAGDNQNSTIQMFEERDGKSLPARCN